MTHFIPPKPCREQLSALGVDYIDAVPSLIDGKREMGQGQSKWQVIYPGTEEVLANCTSASAEQVSNAIESASTAFDNGIWRGKPLADRQKVFRDIAALLTEHSTELAALQTAETGIPYNQFKHMHAARASENFTFFADVASTMSGDTYQQTGRYLSLTMHEPIGVGAVISPWNAPVILASMKIAACMIIGNSCVLKPSEYTPYSQLRMVEIMIEAGVPPQAIQVLNGLGAETGAAVTEHPKVGAINFVGGTETGKRIMASAGQGLKKVALELGGKSANIILDDCDIDQAVDGSLLGFLAGNGEQCLSGSRILVQSSIYNEVVSKLVERVNNLVIGDPFEDVEIGPMAFKAHYDRVLSFTGIAEEDGDTILCGGQKPEAADKGYYYEPVLAGAESNSTRICQDEIFGPFASIVTFDTVEEAIAIANDSDFGLVSYVWTNNTPRMMKVMGGIRAGTVWVNTAMTRDLRAPFGGYKMSGVGRDGMLESIELFAETKTVMIPSVELTLPKLGTKV